MIDGRKEELIRVGCSMLGGRVVDVLDLGCGDCTYGAVISRVCRVGRYVGVDAKPNCRGFETVRADLQDNLVSLINGSFDVVLMLDVLEHLTNYGRALDNARFLIKDGGLLLISTIGIPIDGVKDAIERDPEHVHLFTPTLLRRALIRHGFQVLTYWQNHELIYTIAKPT